MEYLLYAAIGIAAIVVVFLIVVAIQPADFRIARTVAVEAPPAAIFPYVNDLRRFDDWSPFAKLDPNMKKTYEGPEAGVGSSYSWSGKDQAGQGKMTIVESRPHERVRMNLDFTKPMECQNQVEFLLEQKGDKVHVSWIMTGTNNFIGKAFHLLFIERMVGGSFEEGLSKLKSIAEADAKKPVG